MSPSVSGALRKLVVLGVWIVFPSGEEAVLRLMSGCLGQCGENSGRFQWQMAKMLERGR